MPLFITNRSKFSKDSLMNDLMNDIEINNVNYKYKFVHINNLPNFLAMYKLINSFELIIKEHKLLNSI